MTTDNPVFALVVAEWERWPQTKHKTDDFGFKDLLKQQYGFIMYGQNKKSFRYTIVDEKKFAWFLLGGRIR